MKENLLIRHFTSITIVNTIGITICVLIIVITFINHEFGKPTFLTVQLAPGTAELTLENTNTILRTGTYELQPGTYTGTITAKGFNPKTVNFEVKPRTTNSLVDYLINSSEGLGYYEKSTASISTLRLIKDDQEVTSFLESYDRKNSIYDKLPFSKAWYPNPDIKYIATLTISDGRDDPRCSSSLCLKYESAINDHDVLRQTLSENGFNINDYEAIYEQTL